MVTSPSSCDPPTVADLARVNSIVAQHLPPSYDRENLASDILIESWTNGQPQPSWGFIRNRCIDLQRSQGREKTSMRDKLTHPPLTPLPDDHVPDELNHLTKVLDAWERKVIYHRFYLDLTLESIAKHLSCPLDRIRNTLAGAIYKMQQEGLG